MTRMKAYAMYPLCWAAWIAYMVMPITWHGLGLRLLPYAGMYAHSDTFKDFCQCKPFRRTV